MNLLATSHLAKTLGAENFGTNSFAISYIAYFMIVVDLGYETFLAREIAFDPTQVRRLVNSTIPMRLMIAVVMFLLLMASLRVLHSSRLGERVLLVQGFNLFSSAIGLTSVYQGLQRMRVVAGREFMLSFVNMTGLLCLVRQPDDVVLAACITVGTAALTNGTILACYARDFGLPRLRFPGRAEVAQARQSMTYFWSVLSITLTYNMHLVLLGVMRSDAEVGLFSAGWKLFNFAIVIPNLISTLFLPHIANRATRPAECGQSTEILMETVLLCGVPVTVIGEALIPQILTILFGPAYLPASGAVSLLLLNALVVTLNIGFGMPLVAMGRPRDYLRVLAIGAAVGLISCLALIPPLGIMGAAFGTLLDEITILILFVTTRPAVSIIHTLDFGARCLLAVAPGAALAHFIPTLPLLAGSSFAGLVAGGSVGVIGYLVGLRLLRIDPIEFAVGLKHLR
jgi:O-antigen/teichoic acid export membrane protein